MEENYTILYSNNLTAAKYKKFEKSSPELIQEKRLKEFEEARLNVLNYYNEKIAMGGILSPVEELNKSQIEAQIGNEFRRRSDDNVKQKLIQQQESRIDQLERQLMTDSIRASQG